MPDPSAAAAPADEAAKPAHDGASAAKPLGVVLGAVAALALAGLAGAIWLSAIPLGERDPRNWVNAFYVVFARHEPLGLAVILLLAVGALLWLHRGAPAASRATFAIGRITPRLLAGATLVGTATGAWIVCHGYPFTADEYMADFQARLFLAGKVTQEVPEFWRPMLRLIAPTFVAYLPETHSWTSSYLPVYAAIRAVFMSIGLQWLTNPLLAAVSVLTIAAIARKLWPDDALKPAIAAALLAASPQFLVTSMTGYAMPAHLALNLIWLWLYCDAGKRRFWFAPFVGMAALGLHQPFFHALFVTPFLFRLLLQRRWRAVFWFAGVYVAGVAAWWSWWHHFAPANASGGAAGTFALGFSTLLIQSMNLGSLLGWLAFPLSILALLGFGRMRKEEPLLFDAAVSCLLTFGFYVFVRNDQGHGWGYRYFHGTLGCLILVALSGWELLARRIGRAQAATFLGAGLAASLLVQLPLRAAQVESFIRPWARASADFQRSDAELVVFDPRYAWYSADLRRNDPLFEQKPVVVMAMTLRQQDAVALQQRYPRARMITPQDLERLGLEVAPLPLPKVP